MLLYSNNSSTEGNWTGKVRCFKKMIKSVL